MSEVCQICFCIDGNHADYCPNKQPTIEDIFGNIFKEQKDFSSKTQRVYPKTFFRNPENRIL